MRHEPMSLSRVILPFSRNMAISQNENADIAISFARSVCPINRVESGPN